MPKGPIARWRKYQAFKQDTSRTRNALGELSKCVSGTESLKDTAKSQKVAASLGQFSVSLNDMERSIFLRRYWYLDSAEEIAEESGLSVRKIRSVLYDIRKRLNVHLEQEDL